MAAANTPIAAIPNKMNKIQLIRGVYIYVFPAG
jgi:hypothetical protein